MKLFLPTSLMNLPVVSSTLKSPGGFLKMQNFRHYPCLSKSNLHFYRIEGFYVHSYWRDCEAVALTAEFLLIVQSFKNSPQVVRAWMILQRREETWYKTAIHCIAITPHLIISVVHINSHNHTFVAWNCHCLVYLMPRGTT
jgi:hypothetical protein